MSERPIARAFDAARGAGRAALIPYYTAGFPTRAACLDALRGAQALGADLVEVGIPFSDPLADGPTIQRSTQTALEQGMTVAGVLQLVREARLDIPVVLMTYVNPVLAYGVERFAAAARAAGVAGVLFTDLPAGAAPELERAVTAAELDLIRLVAPTTTDERLRAAVAGAGGFVYLISRLGVTGARPDAPADLERHVRRLRAATRLPIAVGFGISTPAHAAAAARWADGVVVGSALVDALGSGGLAAAGRLLDALAGAVATQGAA
ncbi:MAG TPA: tryptophan synthase subunit alpha [Gemmatimonadales bacterium]|nr:tryptophan synthase subunit alpha [Gemmatimonadales bacterium]